MKSPETSPTLVLNEQVNALWAAGKDVLHLGFGESLLQEGWKRCVIIICQSTNQ